MYLNILKSVVTNKLGLIQRPAFVTYFPTWKCNHRCIFCDVWKKDASHEEALTVDEAAGIFQQIGNIDVLRISGGEPFMRPDLVQLIEAIDAVSRPPIIHLTTNGILTKRIVEFLQALKPAAKVHIKVSIDNVGPKHDQVRGVEGAYARALETVQALAALRHKRGFHVGVNQALVSEAEAGAYDELRTVLAPYGVPIYPVIAHTGFESALYSANPASPDIGAIEYQPFGVWSKEGLQKIMEKFLEDSRRTGSLSESIVDRYYLKGLLNRLVAGQRQPNPPCVALNNHLRILPNGDVPICYYNKTVVGNLRRQSFQEIWRGQEIKPHRQWVARCAGCWESCEVAVSAVYQGDIWKGLF